MFVFNDEDFLKKVDREYRFLFENLPDIVYTLDSKGNVTYINQAAERLLGYTRDELTGVNFSAFVHPEDLKKASISFKELASGKRKKTSALEIRIQHKQRDKIYFTEIHSVAFYGPDGNFTRATGVARNITERKEVEQALKQSELKYRMLVERSADAIFVTDSRGRYVEVNAAASALLGYTREEILSMSVADVTNSDLRKILEAFNLLKEKGFYQGDLYLRHKDGHSVPIWINCAALDNGYFLGSCRDITERIRSENALRESEERYRTLVDSLDEMVFMLNHDRRFIACNKKVLSFTGLPHILQKTPEDVLPQELAQKLNDTLDRIFNTGKSLRFSVQDSISGKKFCFEVLLSPIKDESGKSNYILGVVHDITRLKEAQELLKSREIERANREKLAAIGQMAAGMAHELRNPLTTIKGFAQLLVPRLKDEKNREYLGYIVSEIDRTNQLIKDFLAFARPKNPQKEMVHVNEILKEIIFLVEGECLRKNVNLVLNLDPAVPRALLDPPQIKQVILNLVHNALQSMSGSENPSLKLSTSFLKERGSLEILVGDSGMGIPPENLVKLGTPFFSTREGGTGLGLSICYRIVENHGGQIEVESEEGKGTTFKICLPAENQDNKAVV